MNLVVVGSPSRGSTVRARRSLPKMSPSLSHARRLAPVRVLALQTIRQAHEPLALRSHRYLRATPPTVAFVGVAGILSTMQEPHLDFLL